MRRSSAKQALTELLSIAASQKKISHAYVACGSLLDEKPCFEHLLAEDGRDVFDLASLTKALVTTPLLFSIAEQKTAFFEKTLQQWLGKKSLIFPRAVQELKLGQLLSHSSGLPAWRSFWISCSLEKEISFSSSKAKKSFLKRLEEIVICTEKPYCYSDIGFILLGYALELIENKNFDQIFYAFCRDKLKLSTNLCFNPQKTLSRKCVPTSYCSLRKKHLCAEVHDENSAFLGGACGHAGLFGSGADIISYLKALLGTEFGQNLLKRNLSQFEASTTANSSSGWQQGKDSCRYFHNGKTIGHLGFTGCSFWLAEERLEYGVFLSNRVMSGRRIEPWMSKLRVQVYKSFQEILNESVV